MGMTAAELEARMSEREFNERVALANLRTREADQQRQTQRQARKPRRRI